MDRRQSQKPLKACSNALPTDDQVTLFLLEPYKRVLRLNAGSVYDRCG